MRSCRRRLFLQSCVIACLLIVFPFGVGKMTTGSSAENAYHHLVILGDPHLPGRDYTQKKQALATINSWNDVEMVVAVGDICVYFGTDAEYATAKEFFRGLDKPLFPITGNHDFYYKTPSSQEDRLVEGTTESKKEKLGLFRRTFGLSNYYYSRHVGRYLLVFLSADHSGFLAGISDQQLAWLRTELNNNRKTPTLIFFHAPLKGTLRDYRPFINTPDFIAQPVEAIHTILKGHPQVFLWVSGHTHTPPLEESYASSINLYAGQVTNIHNKDMNRGTIWTNSLFLYPDKVVVKTYNHEKNTWLPQFERTIPTPKP
jgi:3',5'-cyclic-AMP phosphodiesterase